MGVHFCHGNGVESKNGNISQRYKIERGRTVGYRYLKRPGRSARRCRNEISDEMFGLSSLIRDKARLPVASESPFTIRPPDVPCHARRAFRRSF